MVSKAPQPGSFSVRAAFQPIISLPSERVVAYEGLARGADDAMYEHPEALLADAEEAGVAVSLSEEMRAAVVAEAAESEGDGWLFVNSHPLELRDVERLAAHCAALQAAYPALSLALEVHEGAMADVAALVWLERRLQALGIGVAFDDFGTGEARLVELVEAPPDFLKFDPRLLAGVERGEERQSAMLRMLVAFAQWHGITPICEGVESRAAADACARIGFTMGQGFVWGRPRRWA